MRVPRRLGALTALMLVVAGCSSTPAHLDSAPSSTPVTHAASTSSSTTSSSTSSTTTTTTTSATFTSSVSAVSAAQLGATWHAGCPVQPDQLRLLQMSYWGFDNVPHQGTMVVNASVANPVLEVFERLFADHFPLTEMVPEAAYGGDDNAAAAADDTSGFNCRYAVAPGTPQWSMHAYGEAIDVNDVQNPYVDGATVIPPAGSAYLDRTDVRAGMAVPGGTLVDAFASIGWQWGGRWTGSPDYQHFSINGQ